MKRMLVILDLNGCLIERLSRQERKMANLNPNRPKVDCTINQRQIFIRPHTDYFISSLTSIPNIDVFVWTSAKEKNAIPICQMLFKERFKSLKCIWHRAMCEPIKGTLRDTVKDLSSLWSNETFKPFYNPTNTVIVDDSMTKLHRHPANAVIIPPYTVSDPSIRAEDDTALLSLLRYLRFAADHINVPAPSDVRDFLRSSPFSVTFNSDTSTSYSSSSATYGRSDDEDSSSSVGSSLPDSSTTAFSSSSNVTSFSLLQTPLDRAMCGYGGSKTTYLSTENQNRIRYSLSDEWKDYDDLDLTKSIELRNEREQKKAEMRAQEEKDRIERKIKKAREKKIRKRERKRLAISVTRELLANAQGTLVDVNETTEKASDSLQKHLEEECARQC